jgi:hypothetical protein
VENILELWKIHRVVEKLFGVWEGGSGGGFGGRSPPTRMKARSGAVGLVAKRRPSAERGFFASSILLKEGGGLWASKWRPQGAHGALKISPSRSRGVP